MAVEARRECGYRKIGGTYLVVDGPGFDCGRFPLALLPCPLCEHRPPFTRGLQRITPKNVLHASPVCKLGDLARCQVCPLGSAVTAETGALAWVGERFYSPETFNAEAGRLGISKRIGKVPEWLKAGETWVFLAHPHGIQQPCPACAGTGSVIRHANGEPFSVVCEADDCDEGRVWTPAVFSAFRPSRIERIVPDTMPEAERQKLRDEGLTPVVVPHDDPDHSGKAADE